MSTDPLTPVRAYWDRIFLERDLDSLHTIVTDPFTRHTSDGTRRFTVDELRSHLRDAISTFRVEDITFDDIATVGDRVWMRATLHGVSLAAMAPFSITWLAQYRVEHDRIAESWSLHQTNLDWHS